MLKFLQGPEIIYNHRFSAHLYIIFWKRWWPHALSLILYYFYKFLRPTVLITYIAIVDHCDKRYLKRSSPLENCISGNGKRPCWCRNIFSLAHAGILHSSMLEMSSGMEECKITAWAKDNMPLAYAGILHSSMPEMSEESSIFYILCSYTSGGCGLGV